MRRVPDLKSPWREAFEGRVDLSFEQAFDLGIELYGKGHPWHAHEVWEELWQGYEGPGRRSLQALIQLAAARHHAQNENAHGMRTLLERSLKNLSDAEDFGALDKAVLLEAISDLLSRLNNDALLDPGEFPTIGHRVDNPPI